MDLDLNCVVIEETLITGLQEQARQLPRTRSVKRQPWLKLTNIMLEVNAY